MRARHIRDVAIGAMFGLTIIVLTAWCSVMFDSCESNAWASDEITEAEVVRAVQTLQPGHSPPVAAAWGGVIWEAGQETSIDPLLITAIVFRESSIQEGVVGTRGEVGPMQLHGAALHFRPRRCDPREISCSIRGGSAVLSYWRAACNEDAWNIWVGAYGLGRCPAGDEAADLRSVRRARELYERIGGTGWEE